EYSPSRTLRSVLFLAQAVMRTRTSPGPGRGTGQSSCHSSLSGPPWPVRTMAHIVSGIAVVTSYSALAQDFAHGSGGGIDDDIGLGLGQAQGRGKSDDIALRHGAGDHTASEHCANDLGPDPLVSVKEGALVPIPDQLDRAKHALTADFTDIGMIAKGGAHPVVQIA